VLRLHYKTEDGKEKEVVTALWYPTAAEPAEFAYGGGYAKGRVAKDADVLKTDGGWPLVICSHGYSGSGLAWVYLAEHLAARGFFVAAPDHADDCVAVRIEGGRTETGGLEILRKALALAKSGRNFDHKKHAYRRAEIRAVLDGLLSAAGDENSPFYSRIDSKRVAMVGHSLGSYTASSMLGLLEGEREGRIRAAVLLSGGLFPWNPKGFASVKVPLLFFWGEDEREPRRRTGLPDLCSASLACYRAAHPPKYALELKDGTHFSFCEGVRHDTPEKKRPGTAARQVATIRRYVTAFLRRHLLDDREAEKRLLRPTLMTTILAAETKSTRPSFKVSVRKDLSYGGETAHERQRLDLYLPEGVDNFATLLFVHGGAWRTGSKDLLWHRRICRVLAERGFGAAAVNYRLSPAVTHPAHIEDVAAAFAFLRKEVKKAGGDVGRIFVCGHSAGGHLAALLVANERFRAAHGLKASDVAGVIAVSGVYEITGNMFGAFGGEPKNWNDASPLWNLRPGLPPFVILSAERDPALLRRMAGRFAAASVKKRNHVSFVTLPGLNHLTVLRSLSDPDAEAFLRMTTLMRTPAADKKGETESPDKTRSKKPNEKEPAPAEKPPEGK